MNLKKAISQVIHSGLLLLGLVIVSCYDDTVSTNNPVTGGYSHGYDTSESRQCMTLAALSYVNENNPAYIRDSLIVQLSNQSYATAGKWVLDWGPGLNYDNSNMMYVAKDTSANPDRYCVGIRGTDWCYYMNWKEDLWIVEFEKYPYGSAGDSISSGALSGLNYLLAMRDPVNHKTIVSYLNDIPDGDKQMFITGHSLGGQLASVFSAWFLDNGYGSDFFMKCYTYAAPSPGNQGFYDHYNLLLNSNGAESFRVVNPLDLVPNFCATLPNVISNQIPTMLPLEVKGIIGGLEAYFDYYGMVFYNVGQEHTLGTILPGNCNYQIGSLEQYACYVGFEHTTSTYLSLLGAANTNYFTASCEW